MHHQKHKLLQNCPELLLKDKPVFPEQLHMKEPMSPARIV